MVKTLFDCHIKVVRSDNGTEFLNKDITPLLASLRVIHQTSCIKTPKQNGVVERKHRHLLNIARPLRFNSHLYMYFWGDCLLTTTFLINRIPTKFLHGKSSYQILFDKVPDYSSLKIFGCLCYATNLHQSDKFEARALKCAFLGYPYAKKGYRVMDIDTKKCFISRDVKFVEDHFPFKDIIPSHSNTPLFPLSSTDIFSYSDPLACYPLSQPENSNTTIPCTDHALHTQILCLIYLILLMSLFPTLHQLFIDLIELNNYHLGIKALQDSLLVTLLLFYQLLLQQVLVLILFSITFLIISLHLPISYILLLPL